MADSANQQAASQVTQQKRSLSIYLLVVLGLIVAILGAYLILAMPQRPHGPVAKPERRTKTESASPTVA